MTQVSQLRCEEMSDLDQARIVVIYAELGREAAERVIASALEDIAHQVMGIEAAARQGDGSEMTVRLNELIALAEQVGLRSLIQVASDLQICVGTGDHVALAAVMSRLVRVAERALTEVWNFGDPCV